MEESLKLAGTYGFPMVVALYLLIRFEHRLSELTAAIQKVCVICERLEEKEEKSYGR